MRECGGFCVCSDCMLESLVCCSHNLWCQGQLQLGDSAGYHILLGAGTMSLESVFQSADEKLCRDLSELAQHQELLIKVVFVN